MDKRLEEIYNNLDTLKIGINDTFYFKCRSCGKCCKNRYDIMLTPRDLFRIARHLNMTIEDVVKKYCDVYPGKDSKVPIVRLLPIGGNDRCPFLVDKRCIVHEAKPTVCALFPIGRTISSGEPDIALDPDTPMVTGYICQPTDCNAKKKPQVVRDWLAKWGYEEPDAFYLQWNEMLISITDFIGKLEERNLPGDLILLVQETLFVLLYLGYDLENDDILGQFQEKMIRAMRLIEESLKWPERIGPPAKEDT